MSVPEPDANAPVDADGEALESEHSPRQGRVAVAYWIVAGAIYCLLGVLVPWMFLLGFWQSLLYVAGVTALQPVVMRLFA